jgi:(p)ppGpp synthase/HD superfamily hydrolase
MRLSRAIAFAAKAHEGQVDKGGEEYILHPLRVMLETRWSKGTENQQIAAVLHDVVEDTDRTLTEVYAWFGLEVEILVDALTKRDGETYFEYIDRLVQTPGATLIKSWDVSDNLQPNRMMALEEKEREGMTKRYRKTQNILHDKGDM